jgi:hypothetical protein
MSEIQTELPESRRPIRPPDRNAILCTIPQAAAMIGRGQTFIYGAIGDGTISAVKSNKRTLVVVESLYRYAAALPPAKIKPMATRTRKRKAA